MTNQIATDNTDTTLSSLGIAELLGKSHNHVLRDIEAMLEALGIDQLGVQSVYLDGNGQQRKCYHLPRRETEILITGYDVVRRAKAVDRWMEHVINKPELYIE